MHSGDFFKWNKRFSLMYAMGAWTLFGSLAYYTYTQKDPLVIAEPVEVKEKENVKKYDGTHHTTTVVYKENFVPYSTRLLNLFKGPTTADSSASSEGQMDEK